MTIALAGNPNVGKSTVFNALTGLKQHTGNWAGKTVSTAIGRTYTAEREYLLVDLPGTYSLTAHSEEEQITKNYLASGEADAVIIVCDATCLQRGLHLALQCIALNPNAILCVNLMDEAARKGIKLDLDLLSGELGIPVVGCTARRKETLIPLLASLDKIQLAQYCARPISSAETIAAKAEKLFRKIVITEKDEISSISGLDRFFTGTIFGFITMIFLLAAILWITITGANLVSDWLAVMLSPIGSLLQMILADGPWWIRGILIDGMWRILSWVVTVMLPPMAIFFPLFTILEDTGVLPRIAFVLDRPFQKCGACGKQALTCCMGIGCNAAGVVGCRIIDSPRDRMLAILTNALIPCSGRFPILAALCTMFFSHSGESGIASAFYLTAFFVLAFLLTFGASKLLSATALKGKTGSFTLELPPYRPPQFGQVLVRSVLDRTVFVLARAAVVAAPAGMLIWILANVHIQSVSIFSILSQHLNPFAQVMGLDGVILLAFLLGLPANEIVLPLIMMGYLAAGTLPEIGALDQLHILLSNHGWTIETALCTAVFTLCHWPCSTTAISIWKETKSKKWTLIGIFLPTGIGIVLCAFIHILFSL